MEPRRLSLLRHAKAEPGDAATSDRDRPLAPRGFRDANLIGALLSINPPDLILCSPARRTRETLSTVLEHLRLRPRVVLLEALYSSVSYVEAIAEAASEDAAHVLVVGHNPTIHSTAVTLTGHGDAQLRAALGASFPTCALATLTFPPGDWKDIRAGTGTLAGLVTPDTIPGKRP